MAETLKEWRKEQDEFFSLLDAKDLRQYLNQRENYLAAAVGYCQYNMISGTYLGDPKDGAETGSESEKRFIFLTMNQLEATTVHLVTNLDIPTDILTEVAKEHYAAGRHMSNPDGPDLREFAEKIGSSIAASAAKLTRAVISAHQKKFLEQLQLTTHGKPVTPTTKSLIEEAIEKAQKTLNNKKKGKK